MSFSDCVQKSINCRPVIDVITIQHKTKITFDHVLLDKDGLPVDLTPYTAAPAVGTFTGAQIVVRDNFTNAQAAFLAELVIPGPATDGKVTLTFEMASFDQPGLYLAVIDLLIDDQVKQFLSYYFMVNPGLDWTSHGPITIPEIRIALRDTCPEANTLIDELDYSDAEIAFCIRRPLDYWNGCLPPLNMTVSPANFPYRYEWMNATIGELLLLSGRIISRNKLPYSAGGVAVNDNQLDDIFYKLGQQYIDTFKIYAQQKKVSINMGEAFGSLRSDFGRGFFYGQGYGGSY